MFTTMHAPAYLVNAHNISSKFLKRKVRVDIYLPDDLMGHEELHLLLLNDGQDGPALGLQDTLTRLYLEQKLKPVIVVGIHAGEDRINEYGIALHPDFKGRGAK
ncbi:MAG: esterase family protein, partial [Chitinophagaceae bacterium]